MTKPFTTESSAKAREQSIAQRELYTRRHADEEHWVELARQANTMLPMFYVRPSDAAVKGLLRKLKIDWSIYLEAYGWETTADFERLNPKFSMRPLAGLILELWDERKRSKEACAAAAEYRGLKVGSEKSVKPRYPRGVAKARRVSLELSNDIATLNS